MKVLHIITDLSTGGAQMMLYKLLTGIDRSYFEPVVVSLVDKGVLGRRIEALGVPVIPLAMRRGVPSPTALWRLIQVTREVSPDLVQGWMYHGNVAASLAVWKALGGVPVLWNIRHSIYDLRKEKRLTALLIRASARFSHSPARIIYNARASAAQHEAIGYARAKTHVIPNGFDCERFVPFQEARETFRATLGVPGDVLLIGLIARYHPMKDHDNFLRAAAVLASRNQNVHFVMVGKGVDADNAELGHLLRELGVNSQVHLLGERHDIPFVTAALDIATCSSWTEAFPNVIGEAMACGVPCTVTDVGDSAWIVKDTGKVVPPRNPEALARAWRELIDLGPDIRRRLGAAARARIIKRVSLPAVVGQYDQLYREVSADKRESHE